MAIQTKSIALSDGTSFIYKYDDTPITTSGSEMYKCNALASNQYVAYEMPELNAMIVAGHRTNVGGSAFNSTPPNPANWNNTSGDWTFSNFWQEATYFGHTAFLINDEHDSSIKHLITEIDVSRLVAHYSVTPDTWTPSTASGQSPVNYYKVNTTNITCDIMNSAGTIEVGTIQLTPVTMSPNGDIVCEFIRGNRYGDTNHNFVMSDYSDDSISNFSNNWNDSYTGEIYMNLPKDFTINRKDASDINYVTIINDDIAFAYRAGGSSGRKRFYFSNIFTSENMVKKLCALRGIAFVYNGEKIYPVINGGCVEGYTDDINKSGDYKNYHGIHDHSVPSTRPKHGTDDDGIDDMTLGFTGYENGFVNYYICTSGNIANLVGEMSAQTDYPNLIGNIVSLKSYACALNGMYSGDIVPIKVGQYQSTAEGIKIVTTTYEKQIASFKISGAHGTISKPHFLDYAPYTRLEVYIPFCGTVPLPPEVMYNTVTVHIVTDITSGSCTGVVKCNGNIVAQKSGIIGTTIPLSINDSASQNNAFNQGMMNTASAGGKVIAGGAVGSVNAGGILSALGSAFNTTQTMNDNYTRVIGTQGDKSAYAMPKNCYLKRYRTIDLSDDNYTATIGRPVCKRRALASGDGFTVCDNPQVYGSMTLAEKNEIEQFMRNGIIL